MVRPPDLSKLGVEQLVLLTTASLVVRFFFDFKGPWFGSPRRRWFVLTLEILNQFLVTYIMGKMQLSGKRVNDYFQVWAVLLVTLQYSVKVGRPYTRSKQIPLMDLMSSFWSANLLRVQTFYLLRIPLWLIWSLNAVRIIVLFVTSGKGEQINKESMRLLSDYMSYEDSLSNVDDRKFQNNMKGYKYLVHGEHHLLKEVQEDPGRSERSYKIELDPDHGVHKEQLVTVEKVWNDTSNSKLLGGQGDPGNQRKDLCLSFALYKLLRRRFYDLPMHELDSSSRPKGKKKMRRFIFDYILEDSEKAFRITGLELSFLQDLFYSKHATMFAGGLTVPLRSLLLSLSLAAATGYIAYPARYIPGSMDPEDRNRITHGVFITRLMVGIIVLKELLEIILYVCSRWANVLILCKYVQHQCWRRPVVETWMRFQFFLRSKAKWSQTVRQQNLLVTVRMPRISFCWLLPMVPRRGVIWGSTVLRDYTKTAILDWLKELKKEELKDLEKKEELKKLKKKGELKGLKKEGLALDNYYSNAFKSKEEVKWPWGKHENGKLKNPKVDTHIILVWHIATCLCEIHFNELREQKAVISRKEQKAVPREHGPFVPGCHCSMCKQNRTAVSLSNYCAYLVMKSLVPDNGLVAARVLDEVIEEIDYVVTSSLNFALQRKRLRSMKLGDVYDRLMETVKKPCEYPEPSHRGVDLEGPSHRGVDLEAVTPVEDDQRGDKGYEDLGIECSLTRMGAVLGKQLTVVYQGDAAGLWRDLANFWMGFLLHLAANTRAASHAKHLAGEFELITHLWALLTHAGYSTDGGEGLDSEDIPDIDLATRMKN